jgi:8-amino-7-oxononanoate synthase
LQANVESEFIKKFIDLEERPGDDLFDLPRRFARVIQEQRSASAMPFYNEITSNEGRYCQIGDRSVIMMGSNNYLGLTTDPRVREAASREVIKRGTSLTGSRLLNGTTSAHLEFERNLADFLGREDCLVFTTGYQANVGAISALMKTNQIAKVLIVDKNCHASILDGARVAGCKVLSFIHNRSEHLATLLKRTAAEGAPAMVIIDGVYSMEGDFADLPAIHSACKAAGVRLALDDAHGIGAVGRTGRGVEEHFGMEGSCDLVTGTFSKSLASIGGFVAADREIIEYIRFHGRPALFSASLPPGQLAAASKSLEILKAEPWRVANLKENADYWRNGLKSMGLTVLGEGSPIVPIFVGEMSAAVAFSQVLLANGLYANCILSPAVRINESLIRTSVIATHDRELLDKALDIVGTSARTVGLIP